MDIQSFVTFREVARSLSITRSAERLGYAQPTVSVHIRKIEEHYGTTLFERTGKGLRLTADGARLLKCADRIVEACEDAEEMFRTGVPPLLRIGTIETLAAFFLPPILQQFRRDRPQANVALLPSTEADIVNRVKSGELDVGLILDPPLTDGELRTVLIRREELVVVCRPDDPLAAQSELTVGCLHGAKLILTEQGCTYREALERALQEEQVAVEIVSELGSIEAVKQCAVFGMGAALIPRITVADELADGKLVCRGFREGAIPAFYTQLIHRKNRVPAGDMKFLIGLMMPTLTMP